MIMTQDYFSLFFGFTLIVLFLALIFLLIHTLRRPVGESLKLRVLFVRVPRADKQEEKSFLQDINLSEQLFTALSSLKQPFAFEISVRNLSEEIFFYLAVPQEALEFTKRQIQGLFLDAKVEEASDYTIFQPQGAVAAGYLTLDKPYVLPISTYRETESDTFSPILSTLSLLDEKTEGASIQIIMSPASNGVKKEMLEVLEKLKKGEKFKDAVGKPIFSLEEIDAFVSSKKKEDEEAPKIVDEEMVKAAQLKLAKPLFRANVRVVTSASTPDRAEDIFLSIGGAFSKFSSPIRNSFKIIKPRKPRKLVFDYIFRNFNAKEEMILNAEELASIFHIPTLSSEVPNVSWLKTKEAPPPEILPEEGLIIGESHFRGAVKTVRLTDDDRRRHVYTIGQTGTGKSYFIRSLVEQDLKNGKGFCVIDPHGDLIDGILSAVPKERIDDVIVFDPGDLKRPLGLNMLEYNLNRPEEKTFIVNEMQSIFNQLFTKETMGPMFEKYMRNSLLLLLEDAKNEPATLMEVPRIFTDAEFRNRKLARITNPTVIDFWTKEVPKVTGEAGLGNMAPYITSKFDGFITNDYIRPIIGQAKSAFNFRQVMDEGKILLVNLSKGKVGDLNSALIGMIVVSRLLLAAFSRVELPENERRDFYLYIDEFQNYTTDSIATILSEARKYKLCLTVAHQFIAQLKDNIREAVFGNVGNLISFRVGPPDAEILVKHFSPVFGEKDLISIENGNAFAKVLVKGEPTRPFNIKTIRVNQGMAEIAGKLKELSRLKFGHELQEVEEGIVERLRV